MALIQLADRTRLAAYLQRDIPLFLYSLGDLDDFFFPHTRWYGLEAGNELEAALLLYTAAEPEVLLALAPEQDLPALMQLVSQLLPQLPASFYAHLSPGLENILQAHYTLVHHGLHWKMQLQDPARLPGGPFPQVRRLAAADDPHLRKLYDQHYPAHAYDPRMLATGKYFGIYIDHNLVSAAGVHVYSRRYSVAALGNVVTHRQYRGRGLAQRAVSALCQDLLADVRHIGLNVKADNHVAIRLYQSLGFVQQAEYHEYTADRNP